MWGEKREGQNPKNYLETGPGSAVLLHLTRTWKSKPDSGAGLILPALAPGDCRGGPGVDLS